MSEHRQEFLDLCAAWALGCLDETDRLRLDEHVARGCRQCEAAMADFSATSTLLAASAAPAAPAPALRNRVLAMVAAAGDGAGAALPRADASGPQTGADRGRVVELRPRSPWAIWVPVAAAAALAIASGVLWMRAAKLDAELAASRAAMAKLEEQRQEDAKWNAVLHTADARVSILEPTTDGDPRLRARAIYDPVTKRAVVVFENFRKPQARDYQLWVIRDGAPASLGVIAADETGHATIRLENVGDSITLSAFAVSLEPEGGSPNPNSPSGPVVMLGKLAG